MEFSKGDKVKVLPLTTDMFKAGTLIQELADTPIWRKTLEHVNWIGVVENTDGHSSYVRFENGEGYWTYDLALEKIEEKLDIGTVVRARGYRNYKGIILELKGCGDEMTAVVAWKDGTVTIEENMRELDFIGDIEQDTIEFDVREVICSRLKWAGLM